MRCVVAGHSMGVGGGGGGGGGNCEKEFFLQTKWICPVNRLPPTVVVFNN